MLETTYLCTLYWNNRSIRIMKYTRLLLFVLGLFSVLYVNAQQKWHYDFGLGASLHTGNVNNCNFSQDGAITRNDSVVAFDFHYRVLYSSLINRNDAVNHWEETNFEINGGIKMDLYQYGQYSPFLACEMLSNKYKGYDMKLSGLVGFKYKLFVKPAVYDYSVSLAFVYDWVDFTDATALPNHNYRLSLRPKIKQRLADNLFLVHYTFIQPSVLGFHDYIINSVTKLQTQITRKLHLDVSFSYDYRSRVPSEDYKKHDVLTEVSLRFKI